MLDEVINPLENLFRAFIAIWWNSESNTLSSAAFKDSTGVSVDRQSIRTIEESAITLRKRKASYSGVVYISCEEVKNAGGIAKYDAVEGNEYHSLILKPDESFPLSSSTAKRISRLSKLVPTN